MNDGQITVPHNRPVTGSIPACPTTSDECTFHTPSMTRYRQGMTIWQKKIRLPDATRAQMGLTTNPLAVAELPDGWAAATTTELHVARADQTRRWPWAQVDRGRLDAETEELTIHLVSGEEQVLPLGAGRGAARFAVVFRERVQSSVVHVVEVTVPGAGIVRVAVRRDTDGTLFTQVMGPGNVDLSQPHIAELVDEAERQARESVGLKI